LNLPAGKIGNVTISRLICGGNLVSGYAHSRDLIYVSPLLKPLFHGRKNHRNVGCLRVARDQYHDP